MSLSTKARLQPWYQPNFDSIAVGYAGYNIAPHGATARFSYTVPNYRLARIGNMSSDVFRKSAPTTAGESYAYYVINEGQHMVFFQSATVGAEAHWNVGVGVTLRTGQTITGYTGDGSTGGMLHLYLALNLEEFDT